MDNKASEKPTSHTKPTTSHKPTVKSTTETVQHHETKTTADSTSPKSPSKANTTIRKASKSPVRSSDKSPTRSPTKSPSKSPTRSPVRSPVRSPARSPVRSPPRSPPKPTNTKPIPTHTPSLIQTKTLSEITQILTCEINNDFIPISYFVIDEKKRTQELLRNRDSTYINLADEASLKPEKIRMAIISALRFDKHVVFDLMDNENLIEPLKKCCAEIEPNLFEDLFNGQIKNEDKFKKLIKDTDGDLYKPHFFVKENMKHFKVILLLNKLTENDVLIKLTSAYRVVN